jgi:hypothetical protein
VLGVLLTARWASRSLPPSDKINPGNLGRDETLAGNYHHQSRKARNSINRQDDLQRAASPEKGPVETCF